MATSKCWSTVQLVCAAVFLAVEAPANAEDAIRSDSNHTLSELLHGHFVVPDIIPVAPQKAIKVSFGDTDVEFGTILPFDKVKDQPTKITWPAFQNALYTLILYGPDIGAPDLLTRGWDHWRVVNIPGNRLSEGDVHTKYNGVDNDLYRLQGLYRILFLVYKQPLNESIPVPKKTIKAKLRIPDLGASLFSLGDFTKSHGFSAPVAANMFHVEGTDKIIED